MVDKKAIVNIVEKITQMSKAPCKKTLQKMVYLMEAKGADIGCDYGIHFYGPYSYDLDFAVRELNNDEVLKIEYTDTEHRISVIDDSIGKEYSNEIVDNVIKEYASYSPSDLELIATTLYVFLQSKEIEKVKSGVFKVKGNKYTGEKIDQAIEKLKSTGFLVA